MWWFLEHECSFFLSASFDFYLPNLNTCIEFDGQQHYNIIEHFGGEKILIENQVRDDIKNKYCLENNIKILRIKYDDDVENKMKSIFKQ